jgi:hypothetical protein
MHRSRLTCIALLMAAGAVATALAEPPALPIRYEGIAYTTNAPGGNDRSLRVKITVERWTTREEAAALRATLESGGQDALLKAMETIEAGYMQVDTSLRWRVRVATTFETEKGRVVRIATDRPISFVETANSARSMDYPIGAVQFLLPPDGKPGEGAILGAVKMDFDDKGTLVVESLPSNIGPNPFMNVKGKPAPPPRKKKEKAKEPEAATEKK